MSFLQHLIPKHFLSNLMFKFTRLENRLLYKLFTKWFISFYRVDMSEALEENIINYKHFNDFFTRALKPNSRPISNGVISPVDGFISQSGKINNSILIQAKGKYFSINDLLGKNKKFKNFTTIYLAPSNYHRIHMPFDAKLISMDYITGNLFSVNIKTTNKIDNLLAKNERVICYFRAEFGLFALVLVGAIFVGSIEVVWHGQVTPPYGNNNSYNYDKQNIYFKKGVEIARFNMGSTVIMLLPENLSLIKKSQKIKIGQTLYQYGK